MSLAVRRAQPLREKPEALRALRTFILSTQDLLGGRCFRFDFVDISPLALIKYELATTSQGYTRPKPEIIGAPGI